MTNSNYFIGLLYLLASFFSQASAQTTDSSFQKKALTTLEVKAFFSLYEQEGQHSAVTGGLGDEQLSVYHTGGSIAYGINEHLVLFKASVDVISSPSTDRIDFITSSASAKDNHVQAQLGYQYDWKEKRMQLGAAYLWSIESDYWSDGLSLWWWWTSKNKMRQLGLSAELFWDDLRWGRLNRGEGYRPSKLVYPSELRNTNWFDIYHRHSYNLQFSWRQDINKRLRVQWNAGLTHQEGLLSTPFHRIYFRDTSRVVVERLPQQRWRLPLTVAASWFLARSLVLQPSYRFYWDNFGIWAQTLQVQAAIKLHQKLSLYPFVRWYHQTASPYFAPYQAHWSNANFYTSDYDYSNFMSVKTGVGVGWYPDWRLGKRSKIYFNHILLRYAFFYRTDGLSAHIISLQLGLKK